MPVQPVSELIYRSYRDQYAVREANEKLAKRATQRLIEQQGILYRELAFWGHQARIVERESDRRGWRTQPLARYRSSARRLLLQTRPELPSESEPERKRPEEKETTTASERRPNFSFCLLPVPPPDTAVNSGDNAAATSNGNDWQRKEVQLPPCKYGVHEGQTCRYYPCTPTPLSSAGSEHVLRSGAGSRRSLVETLATDESDSAGRAVVPPEEAAVGLQQVGRELLARQDQLRLAMALRRSHLFALRGSSAPESLAKTSFGMGSHTAKRAAKRSGLLPLGGHTLNLPTLK